MTNEILRMCVQSRKKYPRTKLIRLVMSNDTMIIDNDYKIQGRSIYIQNDIEVISKFLKRKKLPLRIDNEKQLEVRKLLSEHINEK